jgi:hypothetical protein
MRGFVVILGILFCCFPYTQIITLESYTQPYALVFSGAGALMYWEKMARDFPRPHLISLLALALSGLILSLIAAGFSSLGPQEGKSLLMYVSPLAFAGAAFLAYREYPVLLPRVIAGAALVWILVGLIQRVYDVSFATALIGTFQDTATGAEDSGRGVLGLAPEPTHFGFHMLVLAAALSVLRKYRWISLLCVMTALVLAASSSALFAIVVGTMLYLLIHRRIGLLALLFAAPFLFALKVAANDGAITSSSRIIVLLNEFLLDPGSFFFSDYSVNARLGGMAAGIGTVFHDYFIPHGIANADWLSAIGPLLSRYPWLIAISEAGIPSGFVIFAYQLGALALLLLYLPVRTYLARSTSELQNWLLPIALIVFMGQYLLSTPGFGLLYGLILAKGLGAKNDLARRRSNQQSNASFSLRPRAQH